MTQTVLAQFKTESGEDKGAQVELPTNLRPNDLQEICDALLQTPKTDRKPYMFFVKGSHITDTIATTKDEDDKPIVLDQERVLEIIFAPQAIFRVEPVTRCISDMPGHGEAIVSASFSPNGKGLASGSGDKSVRFWDVNTQTPVHTCQGHKHWVLAVAWSPDAEKVASGCKNGDVNIWCPKTGQRLTKYPLIGHTKYITCLAWEPINCNPECRRMASSSKDSTIRIWDTVLQKCEMALSGHSMSVTCIKWSANGLIYSASQDRTVKVWRGTDGVMCRSLDGHAHWVNTLALNCEYIVRTGPFDPEDQKKSKPMPSDRQEMAKIAQDRYDKARNGPIKEDMLVSGSDDFTMFLWCPESAKKPVARLTGHQQLINDVKFSPDMRYIASASFDKSIRLWNGLTGKFITTLRGHVQRVYQLAWSADSRLLASSSADSTCKVWSIAHKKLLNDLPGHADEVYVVDWSPDGVFVVSGVDVDKSDIGIMLSKLSSSPLIFRGLKTGLWKLGNQGVKPNLLISKRWSGHNNMDITPSRTELKFVNNWIHYYIVIGAIPILVITTIINIRANPELSEVPEGYEPRHWEYHKHPITRWIARYLTTPGETEYELFMALHQDVSEINILDKITKRVEKVMTFYNDHRTLYFYPFFGEYIRSNRDEADFQHRHVATELGEFLDQAYDPDMKILPTEGYLDGPPIKS